MYNHCPCWFSFGFGVNVPDVIFFLLSSILQSINCFQYSSSEGNILSGLSEKYTVI